MPVISIDRNRLENPAGGLSCWDLRLGSTPRTHRQRLDRAHQLAKLQAINLLVLAYSWTAVFVYMGE